jgi:hypothetical protein
MMRLASLGASVAKAIIAFEIVFGLGWTAGNLFQAIMLVSWGAVR